MHTEFLYAAVTDTELNDLMAGREAKNSMPWMGRPIALRLPTGSTGVVWKRSTHLGDPVRPLILISSEEEHRRLCGRFAQVRSDFSPLTAWCHLLTPQRFESLDSPTRYANLLGLEAAWTGLTIGEAVLLADRPLSKLRIPACFATQTFAIARAKAIWSGVSTSEILKRFDDALQILKTENTLHRGELRIERIRTAIQPIWASLAVAELQVGGPSELAAIAESLRELYRARSSKDADEAARLAAPLLDSISEARSVAGIGALTPERRLQLFDTIVAGLDAPNIGHEFFRRTALTFLAGYLATVAAGGSSSLNLALAHAARWPEIAAWAYTIGGIGERVVWTSSFDGLGRLVARELLRPLRLDEPPTSDFALDEATVLVDTKLQDPLVHLRIKQSRVVSVALLPGVNIFMLTADPTGYEASGPEPRTARQPAAPNVSQTDLMAMLADAIWTYLRTRLDNLLRSSQGQSAPGRDSEKSQASRGRQRSATQSGLPLRDHDK